MNMKRAWTLAALLAFAGIVGVGLTKLENKVSAQTAATARAPIYQVDPTWSKPLPNNWVLGQVSAICLDAQENVWILHRYRTVRPEFKAAPPVVEFDSAGNFIKAWGGVTQEYEWPRSEHQIFIDYKGFVWIGGENGTNQLLKFTQDGKLVMQIGKNGASKGHTDTENFVAPTDQYVLPRTNELFVADTGNGRGRIVVMDADTGKFKRMWGGQSRPPADAPPQEGRGIPEGDDVEKGADPVYMREAHRTRVSNDGIVYASDGPNKRFHVFTADGKFVKVVWVGRERKPLSVVPITTVVGDNFEYKWGDDYRAVVKEQLIDHHETTSSLALSGDSQQQYLLVYDRSRSKIMVYDRKSLTLLNEFGDGPGRAPGQLYIVHDMRGDSHGNVYVAEINVNSRVQKFMFKGYLAPTTVR